MEEYNVCIIYMVKLGEIDCKWYVVDVIDVFLGCFLIVVVLILCGKNKFIFIFNVDIGDNVIVINVSKVVLIGKKVEWKIYYYYIVYVGGLKEWIVGDFLVKEFIKLIEILVKGMFFYNFLGYKMGLKLYVYVGVEYM